MRFDFRAPRFTLSHLLFFALVVAFCFAGAQLRIHRNCVTEAELTWMLDRVHKGMKSEEINRIFGFDARQASFPASGEVEATWTFRIQGRSRHGPTIYYVGTFDEWDNLRHGDLFSPN